MSAGNWSDLGPRLVSAFVLAAVSFSMIYAGIWSTAILATLGCGVMCWEWKRITSQLGTVSWSVETFLGFLVIFCAGIGFVWLRAYPIFGLSLAIWLPFVVIAADAGAYFAGRLIGGPKLAPSISPNKTISGSAGGLVLAVIVGVSFAVNVGASSLLAVGIVSAFTGIAAQLGDLVESAAKRRYGVKDASNILPGHGGVLDRFDGLLAATLFTAIVTMIAGSTVLSW